MLINYWECPFRDYDTSQKLGESVAEDYGCIHPLNKYGGKCGLDNHYANERDECLLLDRQSNPQGAHAMTTTLTAINDFHNTECEVPVIETFENDYGHVAVLKPGHITWASKQLCGISGCTCHKFRLEDADGNNYAVDVPSQWES